MPGYAATVPLNRFAIDGAFRTRGSCRAITGLADSHNALLEPLPVEGRAQKNGTTAARTVATCRLNSVLGWRCGCSGPRSAASGIPHGRAGAISTVSASYCVVTCGRWNGGLCVGGDLRPFP